MQVAIIVLNWNGLDDTRACASSLAQQTYPNARVYLVDNASSDGSAATLPREFPQFTHVANTENLGFTEGNNRVIARALSEGANAILLLNNDTEVAPNFLEHLVAALDSDPQVGMVGPKIFFHDEPERIWYAGGRTDYAIWRPFSHVGQNEMDRPAFAVAGDTDWITGCCVLVRAALIRQVGVLNPVFGFVCEDVDWSLRARRVGWQLRYQPEAKVWHKISRSFERSGVRNQYYADRNCLLVARRELGIFGMVPVLNQYWDYLRQHVPLHSEAYPVHIEAILDAMTGRTGIITAPGTSRRAHRTARLIRLCDRVRWWVSARVDAPARKAYRQVYWMLNGHCAPVARLLPVPSAMPVRPDDVR